MPIVSLLLTPSDVSLFRDPRPFGQGDTNARSLLPFPQTTAGAVRTWLLRGLGANLNQIAQKLKAKQNIKAVLLEHIPPTDPAHWVIHAHLRGPLLCHTDGGEPYFPVPQHLVTDEETQQSTDRISSGRLLPLSNADLIPGFRPPTDAPSGYRPCLFPSPYPVRPLEGYVPGVALRSALGIQELPEKRELIRSDCLYGFEPRLGIGMDSDRNSSQEGLLYTISFLRLKADVGLRVDILTSNDVSVAIRRCCEINPWLPLGGEGKAHRIQLLAEQEFPAAPSDWPPREQRFSTYLATPGLFTGGKWYPENLARQFDLVSAVVGSPLSYSGWDRLRNQPMGTRFAVRAGSVYFWQVRGDAPVPPDPHGTNISDDEEDAQAGWGLCLRGEWDYAQ